MTNRKNRDKIKEIVEEAENKELSLPDAFEKDGTVHRPETIKPATPESYFTQGFADINKSRYIQGTEEKSNEKKL